MVNETRNNGGIVEHRHEGKLFWHPSDSAEEIAEMLEALKYDVMCRYPTIYK